MFLQRCHWKNPGSVDFFNIHLLKWPVFIHLASEASVLQYISWKGKIKVMQTFPTPLCLGFANLFHISTEITTIANSSAGTLDLLLFCLSSPLSATSGMLAFKRSQQVPVVCFISDWDFEIFPQVEVRNTGETPAMAVESYIVLGYPVTARGTRWGEIQSRHVAVLWLSACQTWKLGDKKNPSMSLKPQNLVSGREPGDIIQVSHTEEYPWQFPSIAI